MTQKAQASVGRSAEGARLAGLAFADPNPWTTP